MQSRIKHLLKHFALVLKAKLNQLKPFVRFVFHPSTLLPSPTYRIIKGLHIQTLFILLYASFSCPYIGLTDQVRLLNDKPFYFQFGLMLHNKGGKVQATDGGSDIELSLNAMYLELPVMLNYHIRLAPKVAVIPFAGFYGSLGVDGKQSFDDLGLEIQQNLFGKNKMFQRGDFGGRIGIGLSIHSVYIGASYGGGFLNIAQEDDTSKFRNRSWSLSVGYDF